MSPHPRVEWQAPQRTLRGSQTLIALWFDLQDIRKVSEKSIVLQGGMTDKLGFELGQVDEDNDGEMGGDLMVTES